MFCCFCCPSILLCVFGIVITYSLCWAFVEYEWPKRREQMTFCQVNKLVWITCPLPMLWESTSDLTRPLCVFLNQGVPPVMEQGTKEQDWPSQDRCHTVSSKCLLLINISPGLLMLGIQTCFPAVKSSLFCIGILLGCSELAPYSAHGEACKKRSSLGLSLSCAP